MEVKPPVVNYRASTAKSTQTPSPLYAATTSASIGLSHEIRYYQLRAPSKSNQLDLTLTNSSTLDGFLRVENQDHITVATAFLAGIGRQDVIPSLPVIPGQYYYVTVTGMYGTTGSFTLSADFNPDDPGFEDQLFPLPTSYTPAA